MSVLRGLYIGSLKRKFVMERTSLVLLCAYSAPFLALALRQYGIFLAYLLVIIIGLKYATKVPILLVAIVFSLCVLAALHISSLETLLNIASILLASLYSFVVASALGRMRLDLAIQRLFTFVFWAITMAILASILLSSPLGLLNPISSFLAGERVLVLSQRGGHSILNEFSALGLICLSCGVTFMKRQFAMRLVFSGLLLATGSSTSFLALLGIWAFSIFESRAQSAKVHSNIIRSCGHIFLIATATFVILKPDLTNIAMRETRQIAGQSENNYNGDYTAGRGLLTKLLIQAANEHPYAGSGDSHPVLEYGVRLITGKEKGATSESPLRLAVKYGWPFFVLNLFLWLTPLCLGIFHKGTYRLFFIMSGYTLLLFTTANVGFSNGQSGAYIVFGPVIWLSILLNSKLGAKSRLFKFSKISLEGRPHPLNVRGH